MEKGVLWNAAYIETDTLHFQCSADRIAFSAGGGVTCRLVDGITEKKSNVKSAGEV